MNEQLRRPTPSGRLGRVHESHGSPTSPLEDEGHDSKRRCSPKRPPQTDGTTVWVLPLVMGKGAWMRSSNDLGGSATWWPLPSRPLFF